MNDLIQLRRGTSLEWAFANPILRAGEPGLETDTRRIKIGTGVERWSELGYLASEAISVDWDSITNKPSAGLVLPHAASHGSGGSDPISPSSIGAQPAGNYSVEGHGHEISDIANLSSSLAGLAASGHTHEIANVTGLQDALDGKQDSGNYTLVGHSHAIANVSGLQDALDLKADLTSLANVATTGSYGDLTGTPTLGTAASTDASDYATAAQGSLADSSVQPADLANVATSGNYSDLSGVPALGTSAATDATDYATAAQGLLADSAVQPGDLAAVATSGSYNDLADKPTSLPPASHNHTSADVTDFASAAAANAPLQSLNGLTGNLTIANSTGLTLTTSGSTLTLAAALPPSNLADLADVSGTPTTGQALVYNGTEWQPGDVAAGTTINTLSGNLTLAAGNNVTITTSGSTLTFSAAGGGGASGVTSLDAGTFPRTGSLLTEAGDTLTSESGNNLTSQGSSGGAVLQILRSSIASESPTSLADGELAINTNDELLFYADAAGVVQSFPLGGYAAENHTHEIANVTGLQAALDTKAATASLATVATSGNYTDLGGTPTLGTAAATNATDYATAAQGSLADSAVQPADLANVATSGNYSDLSGAPTLGTSAAADATDYATAAQGLLADSAVQPAALANVATSGNYGDLSGLPTLGTAAATDATDYATAAQGSLAGSAVQPGDLATVATSGSYSDLAGIPSEFTPAAHTHAAADITDFATAASANAPIQSVNNLTGSLTLAAGTGVTITESGSTITVSASAVSALDDLTDVDAPVPSSGQVLKWNGTAWAPADDQTGSVGSNGYGASLLFG